MAAVVTSWVLEPRAKMAALARSCASKLVSSEISLHVCHTAKGECICTIAGSAAVLGRGVYQAGTIGPLDYSWIANTAHLALIYKEHPGQPEVLQCGCFEGYSLGGLPLIKPCRLAGMQPPENAKPLQPPLLSCPHVKDIMRSLHLSLNALFSVLLGTKSCTKQQ